MAFSSGDNSAEAIIDLLLSRSKKKFYNVKLSDVSKVKSFDIFELASLKVPDVVTEKLENRVSEMIRKGKKHLIISGQLSIITKYGYVPLINIEGCKNLNPWMIIFFDIIGSDSRGDQQSMDRQYALLLSTITESFLKTIKVDIKNINKSIKELSNIIKEMV